MLGPIAFQEQALKRRLWAKQREICNAIATQKSVAIKGCHGSGKTYTVAGLVPYALLSDPQSIVLTISPTMRQVKTFWNEVHTALQELPVRLPEPKTTALELSGNNYALGFSSSRGVNAQGFHGKRVYIYADEAIGISGDLWDAIEGIRSAGDVTLATLCNPTVPSGPVYESHTRNRAHTACITISAFDTPNLAGLTLQSLLELPDEQLDYAPFPWLTRRRWVREMYHKWGPTNPRFVSRVLGEFPTQADDAVFQLAWIEKAAAPYEEQELLDAIKRNPRAYVQIGIDVAGPGADETAACARIGGYVIGREAWSKPDALQEAVSFCAKQRRFGLPVIVLGDTVGIGFHFMRAIARYQFDVRPFVANAAPLDPIMFRNMKAEGHWALREYLKDGLIRGLEDEDTKAQLSDLRYRENARGQIEIEGKDEMKARGSVSPDRAEALVMAFARPPIVDGGVRQFVDEVVVSVI
jgi:phage terminase large subunit